MSILEVVFVVAIIYALMLGWLMLAGLRRGRMYAIYVERDGEMVVRAICKSEEATATEVLTRLKAGEPRVEAVEQ